MTRTNELLRRTDNALRAVVDRVELWGEPLFDLVDERAQRLEHLKVLLGNLKVRDTVGKLNSLKLDDATIREANEGKDELTHDRGGARQPRQAHGRRRLPPRGRGRLQRRRR